MGGSFLILTNITYICIYKLFTYQSAKIIREVRLKKHFEKQNENVFISSRYSKSDTNCDSRHFSLLQCYVLEP